MSWSSYNKCNTVKFLISATPDGLVNFVSRKNEQLPDGDVLDMKTVAALRIHIERVIGRVRLFKFLSIHACVPLSMMDLLDDDVKVACGLVNLQERIVKV